MRITDKLQVQSYQCRDVVFTYEHARTKIGQKQPWVFECGLKRFTLSKSIFFYVFITIVKASRPSLARGRDWFPSAKRWSLRNKTFRVIMSTFGWKLISFGRIRLHLCWEIISPAMIYSRIPFVIIIFLIQFSIFSFPIVIPQMTAG